MEFIASYSGALGRNVPNPQPISCGTAASTWQDAAGAPTEDARRSFGGKRWGSNGCCVGAQTEASVPPESAIPRRISAETDALCCCEAHMERNYGTVAGRTPSLSPDSQRYAVVSMAPHLPPKPVVIWLTPPPDCDVEPASIELWPTPPPSSDEELPSVEDEDSASDIDSSSPLSDYSESDITLSTEGRFVSPEAVVQSKRAMIVDRVMNWIVEWLDTGLQDYIRQRGGDTRPNRASGSTPGILGSQGAQFDKGKRRRSPPGGEGPYDEDDENGNQKRPKQSKDAVTAPQKMACPFSKHNRSRYQTSRWRTCCWPGFETIHRLKEHLYRRHLMPKHRCNRCGEDLSNETLLREHQQAVIPCKRQDLPEPEGISASKEQELRQRRRRGDPTSEAAQWAQVYGIIFPDDPVPSPYVEICPVQGDDDGEDYAHRYERFEEYSRRELPTYIRPRVEAQVQRIMEEHLRTNSIMRILEDGLQHMFDTFRHTEGMYEIRPTLPGLPPGRHATVWNPEVSHWEHGALINGLNNFNDVFNSLAESDSGYASRLNWVPSRFESNERTDGTHEYDGQEHGESGAADDYV